MTLIATRPAELTEREFQRISRMVYEHCGINLHEGKRELVRARMATRLRAGGLRRWATTWSTCWRTRAVRSSRR